MEEEFNIDYLFNEIASKTIKKYREEKGLSLEDVVKKMKNPISRQSLFKYENNLARMKNNIFIDICQALKIDPNEIFTEINKKTFNATLYNRDLPKPFTFPILDEEGCISYAQAFTDDVEPDSNTLDKLNEKKVRFDNAEPVEINTDTVSIPVLGTIRAGTPIEAQEDIIDYIEIPKDWTKGGKEFYGLKISGDSMYPKYQSNDIVIFEKCEDMSVADGKDCAVLVNGFDATFKKFKLSLNGITLIPYNQDNSDGFETTYYDAEQVENLPIKVIGIAKRRISDIE